MTTDNIFIAGAADGSLVSAFEGLPPWATQATLEDIKGLISKSNGIQAQTLSSLAKSMGGSGLSPDDIKEVNTQLELMGKNLVEEDKEFKTKTKKRWQENDDNHKKGLASIKDILSAETKLLGVSLSLGAAFDIVEKTFIASVNTFDALHTAGVNMVGGFDGAKDGFESLQQLTALTGIRYTELAKTMVKFSTSVNNFGTAKFAKTMAGASTELRKFGYTTQETGDLLGAYLDAQRAYANENQKSQQDTQNDLIRFGKNINNLSMATGMSKDKILENYQALSKTVDANILSTKTGDAASEATLTFISSMKDQNLGKQLLSMMTDTIKPLNSTFSALQKSGNGAFAQKEMNMLKSLEGMDAEQKAKSMAEFGKANEAEIRQMILRNRTLEARGNADATAASAHGNALLQESKIYNAMSDEDRKKLQITSEATTRLKSSWERFLSAFQIFLAPTMTILDGISSVLEILNSIILDTQMVMGQISKAFQGFYGMISPIFIGIGEKFTQFENWISKTFPSFSKNLSGIGDTIATAKHELIGFAGIAALLAGAGLLMYKLVTTFMGSLSILKSVGGAGGIAGAAGGGAGKAAGGGMLGGLGKGLGELGKGLGEMLGGLGTGVGKAIEGILKGLAAGLAAMANPAILVGAAILSGSIAIIGAGIAAATWLMGAALPKFAEGLMAFDDIDGDNLISVAKGIGALGLAMGVFSVGFAAGGLASAIGAIGNTIAKLFGGGSMLDQLKQFASLGDKLGESATAIGTITHSIFALSNTVSSFNIGGLRKIVDTINSIDLLKAAAFGIIGSINSPRGNISGISTNTGIDPTAPKPSTIDSPSSSEPPMGVDQTAAPKINESSKPLDGIKKPAASTDINSTLAFQSSLLEQILLSTNNLVSVNKDILKATKNQ